LRRIPVKTVSAIYKGARTVELSEELDLPEDAAVLVVIPEQGDEAEMRHQLLLAAETVFARLWDSEMDEVWNEYL
jgi:hypothetical protein